MSEDTFDFVVIGGGSAGYAAASAAARLGLRTAVVEGGSEVGGLCILRGCMPSKTLLESAARAESVQRSTEFGVRAEFRGVDATAIRDRKRRLISDFATFRQEQLESGKFEFTRGNAKFNDAHTIDVAMFDGSVRSMRSRSFLIATGSRINWVEIPGLAETGCLASDEVLDAEHIPASVIVLGGGAIAVELASFYRGVGSKVALVQRGPHLVKEMDVDVSDSLSEAFEKHGIQVFKGTELQRVEKSEAGKRVHLRHMGADLVLEAEEIIYALGRRPFTEGLDLPKAGVSTTSRGTVKVNGHQQSSVPHIFAAGDASGPYEVVHIAIQQGELAARNAARLVQSSGEKLESMDYALKLFAVFSHPEAASVGLNTKEAAEMDLTFIEACYPFADHGKAMVRGETSGFVKLIADAPTRQIIGAAVIGPNAAELIHEIAVAMYFKATAGQLAQVPHYHPTLSEIWTYPAEALAEIEVSL